MRLGDRILAGVLVIGAVSALGFGLRGWAQTAYGPVSVSTPVCRPASATNTGCVDITTQTFAGAKTFNSLLTVGGALGGTSLALQSGDATATFEISSATNAATASSTLAAFTLTPLDVLDANDLLLDVQNQTSPGLYTSVFTVDEDGDVVSGGGSIGTTLGFDAAKAAIYSAQSSYHCFNGSNPSSGMCWRASGGADLILSGNATNYYQFNVGAAPNFTSALATSTFNLRSNINDATASSTVAAFTLIPLVDLTAGDLVLNVEDSANNNIFTVDEQGDTTALGVVVSDNRYTLASVFVGAVTTAGTNYGGDVLPGTAFTVDQVTLRISAAGAGGTTDWAFRISDGTNICDCTRACNGATGNVALTCAGAGGTGCALPASAGLTYSVNSIGDCVTGPTVVGNVQVRGFWANN